VLVAEALNNIVEHGMACCSAGTVQIRCGIVDSDFEINILDRGTPYDRLPSDSFPGSRAEHGRGWPIIINWADSMEYLSHPGHNELTLRMHLA
jgi:anti-sigma regulatory factor (Ser/Thr protein kinase)